MIKARKGDRVEFKRKGVMEYGTVSKGGSNNIAVILDGGEMNVNGHVSFFELSNKPVAMDKPSFIDKWGIKSYTLQKGHDDSTCFFTKITLNGKVVGEVLNDGWGGSSMYRFENRELEKQLHNDTKKWFQDNHCPDIIEATDSWIEWVVNKKPYGVLADEFIGEYRRIYAKYA